MRLGLRGLTLAAGAEFGGKINSITLDVWGDFGLQALMGCRPFGVLVLWMTWRFFLGIGRSCV